jgi:hypothetical protein
MYVIQYVMVNILTVVYGIISPRYDDDEDCIIWREAADGKFSRRNAKNLVRNMLPNISSFRITLYLDFLF